VAIFPGQDTRVEILAWNSVRFSGEKQGWKKHDRTAARSTHVWQTANQSATGQVL